MHGRAWIVSILALSSCGEPSGSDGTPVTDTDTDTTSEVDTADSGTPPDPEDDEPQPPTGITEPCWAWEVAYFDLSLAGTYVHYYDPVTLNQTHYEADYEDDGVVDYAWDVAYAPNGEDYAWVHYDTDGDGVVDAAYEYEYDDAGLRTRASYDYEGDGAWDEVWTYDYAGEVRARSYLDEGDDGTTDVWYTYTADEAGRIVRIDGDRGDDGTIDEVYAYTYADLVTADYTYTADTDADGVPEETASYAYDAEGRIVHYAYDGDDGTSIATTYEYGPGTGDDYVAAHGATTYPGQSEYTWEGTYTYEAPGKLSRTETTFDLGASGTTDYFAERTWACP